MKKYEYKLITNPEDPILHTNCKEVTPETENLERIIHTMRYALNVDFGDSGAGLSANQIGYPYRIVCINFQDYDYPSEIHFDEVWINPKVIWESKRKDEDVEACLSIPSTFGDVIRPKEVKIEAYDRNFEKKVFRAKYFYSRVMQHEIDHINGILFTDRATNIRKSYIGNK